MSGVTLILDRAHQGDPTAVEELLPVVYEELRRLAAVKMAGQPADHTLQPTALVHEAYLHLIGNEQTYLKASNTGELDESVLPRRVGTVGTSDQLARSRKTAGRR